MEILKAIDLQQPSIPTIDSQQIYLRLSWRPCSPVKLLAVGHHVLCTNKCFVQL